MKKVKIILIVILYSILLYSQSSMVFDNGTTIEVTGSADICADDVIVNGSHSGDGTICLDNPLPVELISFSSTIINNKVLLNWQTATEIMNFGFEVQRKVVNSQLSVDNKEWGNVGFVEGFGNSNSIKNYSFVDENPLIGKLIYRLKQIDTDGGFSFSNEIEIEIDIQVPLEFALFQNYPNPFNPSTEIRFNISEESNVKLVVFDILGNEVNILVNEIKQAGKYSVQLDGSLLPSGVYYYRIQANNFVATKKLLLIK